MPFATSRAIQILIFQTKGLQSSIISINSQQIVANIVTKLEKKERKKIQFVFETDWYLRNDYQV